MIRTALSQVLPEPIAGQVAGELRVTAKRVIYARSVRRRLTRLRECRVNIGCGGRPTPGWVNLDLYHSGEVLFWDCRRGLPFADNATVAIYTEHAFEHLDPEREARPLLGECLRCLRPGATLRIVVPDAGAYLRAYGDGWQPLVAMRPLEAADQGWRDKWLGDVYRTQMQLINAVFRQGNEHKYAYDAETLTLMLRDAGFARVIRQRIGISNDPDMAPDNADRQSESLYVEAVK